MKNTFIFTFLFMLTALAFGQQGASKHPRVIELEDKLAVEASLYFERRFPGKPFIVRVDVVPLKAKLTPEERKESLPYFEYDTEESIDEWDDLSIPINFLRNRVVKVSLNVLVPDDFEEAKITSIQQDLFTYLKLLPFRDEVKVERKLATDKEKTPQLYYYIFGSLLLSALFLGVMVKWSASSIKTQTTTTVNPGSPVAPMGQLPPQRETVNRSRDPISLNEVTINDSLKMLDLAHNRTKLIAESGTFPTLTDMLHLDALGNINPAKLGALLYEFPNDWQKTLLKYSKGETWLEAFSSPGKLDVDCMNALENMLRARTLRSESTEVETLLIQVWRLKSPEAFFKRVPQEHAFTLLSYLPKSISLPIARNCFPGSWARILENNDRKENIGHQHVNEYLSTTSILMPFYEEKMIEQYRKDKEILSYLDSVSIENERDIYEVLSSESFVRQLRLPFYVIFNLPPEKIAPLVACYPLDVWAKVILNSSRNYIRSIMECLDDKKKVLLSSHLKRLDNEIIQNSEQAYWKQEIATKARELFPEEYQQTNSLEDVTNQEERESA